ncbi:MBOAT family O-acyltransferase [Burkholderia cepacia]|uniref:MBOAT family O-acyltransferase n=1 Tax=Burkholderia cepacia TaxID=292 RepID=UPI0007586196|nr:MBOAT family O-acyltransferase [Burkholderia cepacia]KVK92411.1 hypothetical protein WS93_31055 [Burkholderia cepacia]
MSYLGISFFAALVVLLVVARLATPGLLPVLFLGASLAFYATWSVPCLAVMVGAIAITYLGGRWIDAERDTRRRKYAFTATVGLLLASLVLFKTVEVAPTGSIMGNLHWLIPIGISYYTFKAISYLVEVYWENIRAERDATKVALYVSFFPQILSGPIQRPDTFFEQLGEPNALRPTAETLARALPLLLLGAFEKAVLADRIGPLVSALDQHGTQSSLAALFADYGYTLQLFADFSGLTHIAIGLGVLFGITGPANFDKPFSAKSIPDFWRRWHASLTSWLGDYLFLPLRMALRGLGATGLQLSLMINMVLIGVWHGFKPTYFVFGVYHGFLLIVSTITQPRIAAFAKRHVRFNQLHRLVAPVITFHLVVLGQVFFRAPDLGFAWQNLSTIARATGPGFSIFLSIDADIWRVGVIAAVVSLGLGSGVLQRGAGALTSRFGSNETVRWAALGAMVLFVVLAASKTGGQFMYARF